MSRLTKDEIETLKSLVKKAGWTPMNTKTGSVWFGGKGGHMLLFDHLCLAKKGELGITPYDSVNDDWEAYDFLVVGYINNNNNEEDDDE